MTVLEETAGAVPPEGRRQRSFTERLYGLLTSPKLALALLVGILACCVVGVTVLRGERAWRVIFSTLWFNGLLVLLALSSGAAFFSRVWRRKLTTVQVGMIVFHLSFAALLGGVVYNSLFHFDGLLRLTEGETLPNDRLESYDAVEAGRLFDIRRLRGETTLVRMRSKYEVDGREKGATYELAVGRGHDRTTGIVYVNQDLVVDGVRYLRNAEGYSVLLSMQDKSGREVYAAHVPLQSIRQDDGTFIYATGTSTEPLSFPYPFPPAEARADLLVTYRPSTVKEREGEIALQVRPPPAKLHEDAGQGRKRGAAPERIQERAGRVVVGTKFDAGDFILFPEEIRYWAVMNVRHDPAQNFILGSMCFGLAGMVITFVGRLRQGPRRKTAT